MPFGKYKGYKYGEVPVGYLEWAEEEIKANVNHSPDLARWHQHKRNATTPGAGSWRPGGERSDPASALEDHAEEDSAGAEDKGNRGGPRDFDRMVRGRGEHGGAGQGSGSEAGRDEVSARAGEEGGGGQEGSEEHNSKSRTKLKKREYWDRVRKLQEWKREMRRASRPEEGVRRASKPDTGGEIDGVYTQKVYFAEDGYNCTVDYDEELEETEDTRFPKVNLKYPNDYEAVKNLPSKRMKRSSKKRVRGMARKVLASVLTTFVALTTPVVSEVYQTVVEPLRDFYAVTTGHRQTDEPALLELFAGSAHLTTTFAKATMCWSPGIYSMVTTCSMQHNNVKYSMTLSTFDPSYFG